MMKTKIKIGVSACLLGEKVRYDGGHKRNRALVRKLEKRFELVEICPEVECGLSVPREPMELYGSVGSTRLRVIGSSIDLTGVMSDYAKKRIGQLEKEHICGFVFKNRSPSCAVSDAVILTARGRKKGPGLFRQFLSGHLPLLPVADEEGLADAAAREHFIEQVLAYRGPREPLPRQRVRRER